MNKLKQIPEPSKNLEGGCAKYIVFISIMIEMKVFNIIDLVLIYIYTALVT